MIIVKEQGVFKIEDFDGIIYDSDGNVLDSANYTSIAPSFTTGTVLNKFVINGVNILNIEKGDVVDITGTDGIVNDYIVVAKGDNAIRVASSTGETEGASVIVSTKVFKVELGANIKEGMYYLSNNEVIIVANTFSNAYINKAYVKNRYRNLNDNVDIDLLNSDAKEALIGDFPLNPFFYKALDIGQITELLKRKILSILELADNDRDSANLPLTDDYRALRDATLNILNTVDDNTPNGDVTDPTDMPNDTGITWSTRV